MKFDVLKPFTWAGENLVAGDTLEIPEESSKIGSLVRSRFIRFAGVTKAPGLPTVKEVAREIVTASAVAVEEQTASTVATAIRDPKSIVREAKARAAARK